MLEARVIAIVDAVLAGRQVEDDRVELKAEWPPAGHKVARQIAGHANTAAGEPILWIIGLDEKGRRSDSSSGTEPANWWSAVRRHFVEVTPELKFLRVPIAGDQDVLVLQFATDRAPYVVGVRGGGQVEREVPWREGNSTRTAHRHEMIRAIVAEVSVPTLELIGGSLEVGEFLRDDHTGNNQGVESGDLKINCALNMFLSSQGQAHLPEHRQTLTLRTSRLDGLDLGSFSLSGSYSFDGYSQSGMRRRVPSGNVSVLGTSTVEVGGPGELRLHSEHVFKPAEAAGILQARKVDLDLRMPVDMSDRSARLTCRLSFVPGSGEAEPHETSSWRTRARFTTGAAPYWWV